MSFLYHFQTHLTLIVTKLVVLSVIKKGYQNLTRLQYKLDTCSCALQRNECQLAIADNRYFEHN